MKRVIVILGLIALVASTAAEAQGRFRRGRNGSYDIPPGQLPPPGLCRVWYEGLPPGRQPRAMDCRDAEAIAARDRSARVIYGDAAGAGRNSYPRTSPGRYPRQSGGFNAETPAFHVGYKDGYDQGLKDARSNDQYDPTRHGRYKSADHDYNSKYGSKEDYRSAYREGFRDGYNAGYGDVRGSRIGRY